MLRKTSNGRKGEERKSARVLEKECRKMLVNIICLHFGFSRIVCVVEWQNVLSVKEMHASVYLLHLHIFLQKGNLFKEFSHGHTFAGRDIMLWPGCN